MGKLRSISLTTICKWATSNLLWLYWQMSHVVFWDRPSLTGRQRGYPSKSSPHLIWLMHLFEIWVLFSNHDNYRWNEEWQGSEPDVFITVVSDHGRRDCGRSAEARAETWQCINLSVWRSTEVKRFPDPVTRRSDLTTLSIACAHDKGTADRWKEKIKEQAALLMTWKVSFPGGWPHG